MAFNNVNKPLNEGGNVWSAGSRGPRGGFDRSDDTDDNPVRGGGSYRNNYTRRPNSGGYGFRRNNNNQNTGDEMEVLKDTIFVQNLPENITRDEIYEAFSTVGPIKTDERSGGPKIWIYKDRRTGQGNGRATVTYEDEETTDRAISEYNDKHISSMDVVVHVQYAKRRVRNAENGFRGGFQSSRGFRGGGRNNWNNNPSRSGFNSAGGNRPSSRGGGFRGRGGGDRGGSGGSYRGSRGSFFRGSGNSFN